ncbi:MAG: hypothetical protein QW303_00140 [Nitrososphaerota archaeon]
MLNNEDVNKNQKHDIILTSNTIPSSVHKRLKSNIQNLVFFCHNVLIDACGEDHLLKLIEREKVNCFVGYTTKDFILTPFNNYNASIRKQVFAVNKKDWPVVLQLIESLVVVISNRPTTFPLYAIQNVNLEMHEGTLEINELHVCGMLALEEEYIPKLDKQTILFVKTVPTKNGSRYMCLVDISLKINSLRDKEKSLIEGMEKENL